MPTTQGNFRIIFVTNTSVNGTGVVSGVGSGLSSFDALCASEKSTKNLGGTFKALIGVGQRRPDGIDWILRNGKEYRREDLTTIIDVAEVNVTALGVIFPFATAPISPLTNPITATTKYPWTGFRNNWTIDSSANCADWTDNTSGYQGTYGKSSINEEFVDLGYASWWGGPLFYNADYTKQACDQLNPIYCVQTKQLPPPGAYKKLFLSGGISGTGGFSSFDAKCAADATTKGLSGTYKAVIASRTPNDDGTIVRQACSAASCTGATGMSQAIDWTLLPDMQYRLDDNVTYIGKTNSHGIFVDEFEEKLAASGTFWTGLTNTWVTAPGFQQCNGWIESSFNGNRGANTSYMPDFGTGTGSCASGVPVLCAEQ